MIMSRKLKKFFISLVLLTIITTFLIYKKELLFYNCDADISKLAKDTITSLKEHPDQWFSDSHYLKHKNGIQFWVASGASYLSPIQPTNSNVWKTGAFYASKEQSCVYQAYKKWRETRQYEPVL